MSPCQYNFLDAQLFASWLCNINREQTASWIFQFQWTQTFLIKWEEWTRSVSPLFGTIWMQYLHRAGFIIICHVDKYKKIINTRRHGYFALLHQLKKFQGKGAWIEKTKGSEYGGQVWSHRVLFSWLCVYTFDSHVLCLFILESHSVRLSDLMDNF
jgi:hypothetical protein